MTDVIIERYIASTRDMDDIEAAITAVLGGENHRCSVLRSQSYLRLRVAALYRDDQAPCVAYLAGLKLSLACSAAGRLVTLRRIDPLYHSNAGDDGSPPGAFQSLRRQKTSAL
jgi:hypothetical protein